MSPRESFLQRVRQAVVEGNRAGAVRELPQRGGLGYQGGGPDPVARFAQELKTAGGHTHVVHGPQEAWRVVEETLGRRSARRILLGKCPLVDRLGLAGRLQSQFDVQSVEDVTAATRDSMFQADAGISGVEYLIAETGSVVMATKPAEPRSLSLLPPVHIAFADRRQILPDLFDLFDLFSPDTTPGRPLSPPPSCLTLITGPSKTGDIELRLVTGVHGPGELHVVVCDG